MAANEFDRSPESLLSQAETMLSEVQCSIANSRIRTMSSKPPSVLSEPTPSSKILESSSKHDLEIEWLLRGLPDVFSEDDSVFDDEALSLILRQGGAAPAQLQFPSLFAAGQRTLSHLASVRFLHIDLIKLVINSTMYRIRQRCSHIVISLPDNCGHPSSQAVFLTELSHLLIDNKNSKRASSAIKTGPIRANNNDFDETEFLSGDIEVNRILSFPFRITDAMIRSWIEDRGVMRSSLRVELYSYISPPPISTQPPIQKRKAQQSQKMIPTHPSKAPMIEQNKAELFATAFIPLRGLLGTISHIGPGDYDSKADEQTPLQVLATTPLDMDDIVFSAIEKRTLALPQGRALDRQRHTRGQEFTRRMGQVTARVMLSSEHIAPPLFGSGEVKLSPAEEAVFSPDNKPPRQPATLPAQNFTSQPRPWGAQPAPRVGGPKAAQSEREVQDPIHDALAFVPEEITRTHTSDIETDTVNMDERSAISHIYSGESQVVASNNAQRHSDTDTIIAGRRGSLLQLSSKSHTGNFQIPAIYGLSVHAIFLSSSAAETAAAYNGSIEVNYKVSKRIKESITSTPVPSVKDAGKVGLFFPIKQSRQHETVNVAAWKPPVLEVWCVSPVHPTEGDNYQQSLNRSLLGLCHFPEHGVFGEILCLPIEKIGSAFLPGGSNAGIADVGFMYASLCMFETEDETRIALESIDKAFESVAATAGLDAILSPLAASSPGSSVEVDHSKQAALRSPFSSSLPSVHPVPSASLVSPGERSCDINSAHERTDVASTTTKEATPAAEAVGVEDMDQTKIRGDENMQGERERRTAAAAVRSSVESVQSQDSLTFLSSAVDGLDEVGERVDTNDEHFRIDTYNTDPRPPPSSSPVVDVISGSPTDVFDISNAVCVFDIGVEDVVRWDKIYPYSAGNVPSFPSNHKISDLGCFVCYKTSLSYETALRGQKEEETREGQGNKDSGREEEHKLWWDAQCAVLNGRTRHRFTTALTTKTNGKNSKCVSEFFFRSHTTTAMTCRPENLQPFLLFSLYHCDEDGDLPSQQQRRLFGTARLPQEQLVALVVKGAGSIVLNLPISLTTEAGTDCHSERQTCGQELSICISYRVELLLSQHVEQGEQSGDLKATEKDIDVILREPGVPPYLGPPHPFPDYFDEIRRVLSSSREMISTAQPPDLQTMMTMYDQDKISIHPDSRTPVLLYPPGKSLSGTGTGVADLAVSGSGAMGACLSGTEDVARAIAMVPVVKDEEHVAHILPSRREVAVCVRLEQVAHISNSLLDGLYTSHRRSLVCAGAIGLAESVIGQDLQVCSPGAGVFVTSTKRIDAPIFTHPVSPLAHAKHDVEAEPVYAVSFHWNEPYDLNIIFSGAPLAGSNLSDRQLLRDRIVMITLYARADWELPSISGATSSGLHVGDASVGAAVVDLTPLAVGMEEVSGWYEVRDGLLRSVGQVKVSITLGTSDRNSGGESSANVTTSLSSGMADGGGGGLQKYPTGLEDTEAETAEEDAADLENAYNELHRSLARLQQVNESLRERLDGAQPDPGPVLILPDTRFSKQSFISPSLSSPVNEFAPGNSMDSISGVDKPSESHAEVSVDETPDREEFSAGSSFHPRDVTTPASFPVSVAVNDSDIEKAEPAATVTTAAAACDDASSAPGDATPAAAGVVRAVTSSPSTFIAVNALITLGAEEDIVDDDAYWDSHYEYETYDTDESDADIDDANEDDGPAAFIIASPAEETLAMPQSTQQYRTITDTFLIEEEYISDKERAKDDQDRHEKDRRIDIVTASNTCVDEAQDLEDNESYTSFSDVVSVDFNAFPVLASPTSFPDESISAGFNRRGSSLQPDDIAFANLPKDMEIDAVVAETLDASVERLGTILNNVSFAVQTNSDVSLLLVDQGDSCSQTSAIQDDSVEASVDTYSTLHTVSTDNDELYHNNSNNSILGSYTVPPMSPTPALIVTYGDTEQADTTKGTEANDTNGTAYELTGRYLEPHPVQEAAILSSHINSAVFDKSENIFAIDSSGEVDDDRAPYATDSQNECTTLIEGVATSPSSSFLPHNSDASYTQALDAIDAQQGADVIVGDVEATDTAPCFEDMGKRVCDSAEKEAHRIIATTSSSPRDEESEVSMQRVQEFVREGDERERKAEGSSRRVDTRAPTASQSVPNIEKAIVDDSHSPSLDHETGAMSSSSLLLSTRLRQQLRALQQSCLVLTSPSNAAVSNTGRQYMGRQKLFVDAETDRISRIMLGKLNTSLQ